jgi:hypothetical protein
MALIHEKFSDQFYDWEKRGRGWNIFPEPVRPEPPFRPFEGHTVKDEAIVDDGRRPTFFSSLVQKLANRVQSPPSAEQIEPADDEPEPEYFEHDDLVELRATLPAKLNIGREAYAEFLANISFCRRPIAFEIIGTQEEVSLQFVSDREDASVIRRQLEAHFPEGTFTEPEHTLDQVWHESPNDEALVVEFGLAKEFMLQLRTDKADAFVGIVGALSELAENEVAVFQVLFEPVRANWRESIEYSVCHADGKPFFVNAPELASAGKSKTLQNLYAAVVRIGILTESFDRTLALARDLAGALRVFSNPQGNELIPLKNDEYPFECHLTDLLGRNSRRSGMILTTDELVGFVHLPSSAVRSPALIRETGKSKAVPAIARNQGGILLGTNTHAGVTAEVRLTPEQRVRHLHLIGASGTGKSTLLFNLIRSDIERNQGVAVLDPHGDLIDRILTIIPPERIGDVILVDPSDEEYSIGFNILSAHTDLEKTLLASDLVGIFQRLSTSWGDQMGSVLRNAILAFLESSRGGTLADLRRFLIEPSYRTEFLKTVRDPDIAYYWRKAFPQLGGNKSIGSVLTRLETFLAPKPIRYMVSQEANRLDFADITDSGKIFLAKLPRGEMGEENSFLLGSFLVAKFQQAAMARQKQDRGDRRDFWLYLDEFHNFMTPSMAEILSGTRKYRLGLILAHQELAQLQGDRKVASAVLSNPFTRVIFRVGDADARNLESGLSFFEARDLQNLETGEAICRIEKASGDFNLSIPFSEETPGSEGRDRSRAVIAASRGRYGTPRAEVEAALFAKFERDPDAGPPKTKPIIPQDEPTDFKLTPAVFKETSQEQAIVSEKSPDLPQSSMAAADVATNLPNPEPKKVEPLSEPIVLSEKAQAALEITDTPSVPATIEEPQAKERRELGQGGARHKIIQKRIKEAAECMGFQAVIEKQVPESEKRFDVHLERDGITIACEISFTTTVDHEIGNVSKCLNAGVATVAVICLEQTRLKKIKEAVAGTFAVVDATRVLYFEPTEFLEYLRTLAPPASKSAKEPKKRAGRTVKRTQSALSAEERAAREEEYNRAIADALKRKMK